MLQIYNDLGSWRAVGKALGVNHGVAFLYARTDYEPKRADLRAKFGLDGQRVTYVRQVRNSDGTFVKGTG